MTDIEKFMTCLNKASAHMPFEVKKTMKPSSKNFKSPYCITFFYTTLTDRARRIELHRRTLHQDVFAFPDFLNVDISEIRNEIYSDLSAFKEPGVGVDLVFQNEREIDDEMFYVVKDALDTFTKKIGIQNEIPVYLATWKVINEAGAIEVVDKACFKVGPELEQEER